MRQRERGREGEVGVNERHSERKTERENKPCRVNGNGDMDLVKLNIDDPVMRHEIYMKQQADICISGVRRHVRGERGI